MTSDTSAGSPAPLDCVELVELVSDYLEGALPVPDRLRFEHHLGECAGCSTYLAQMRLTIKVVGRLGADDLPPGSVAPLLELLRSYRQH